MCLGAAVFMKSWGGGRKLQTPDHFGACLRVSLIACVLSTAVGTYSMVIGTWQFAGCCAHAVAVQSRVGRGSCSASVCGRVTACCMLAVCSLSVVLGWDAQALLGMRRCHGISLLGWLVGGVVGWAQAAACSCPPADGDGMRRHTCHICHTSKLVAL